MRPSFRALALVVACALSACDGGTAPSGKLQDPAGKDKDETAILPLVENAQNVTPTGLAALNLPAASTPGELKLVFSLPKGDVDAKVMGAVGFNQPMVPLSDVDAFLQVKGIDLTPEVPLRWQWIGTDTAAFYPQKPLPGSTTFTATVQSALTSLAGQHLKAPVSWQFSTPNNGLLRTFPATGAKWAHWQAQSFVLLEFAQPVDLAQLTPLLKVEISNNNAVIPLWKLQWPTATELATAHPRDSADALPKQGSAVLLRFTKNLPQLAEVQIALAPGLGSTQGPNKSEQSALLKFQTYGPMKVEKAQCEDKCKPDSYRIAGVTFSNPVSLPEKPMVYPPPPPTWLSITPAVTRLDGYCRENSCGLSGEFKPDTLYNVTVHAGISDVFGQKLAENFKFEFRTAHFDPNLDLTTEGEVYELKEAPHRLVARVMNLQNITLKVKKLDLSQLFGAINALEDGQWRGDDEDHDGAAKAKPAATPIAYDRDVAVAPSQNVDQNEMRVIELAPLLGGTGKAGLLALELSSPQVLDNKGNPQKTSRVFQVTDLHIHAKVSTDESVFWLTSYATGKAVAGARVALHRKSGELIWSGTSNADGLATGPSVADADYHSDKTTVVLASLADDTAFMRLSAESRSDWGVRGGEVGADAKVKAFLFSDKNVYRLGETAQVKGIVRYFGKDGLVLPPTGKKVELVLQDPTGKKIADQSVELSNNGSFEVAELLPQTGTHGTYMLQATLDGVQFQTSLNAAVYRTPRFRSKLTLETAHVLLGEAAKGLLTAAYYSGGALSDAKTKLYANGSFAHFEPPGWPDLQFGQNVYDYDNAQASPLTNEMAGKTDATGGWKIHFVAQSTANKAQLVRVEASAEDPNGNPVSETGEFWLHPAAFDIGIGQQSRVIVEGQSTQLQVMTVDALGKVVKGVAVNVAVALRTRQMVRVERLGGVFDWQQKTLMTPVGTCAVQSADLPQACSITVQGPGEYLVMAQAKDAKNRQTQTTTSFYVSGKADVAWNPTEDEGPMIVPDKPSYHIGEVAHLLIKNPLHECSALVTEERAGILRSKMMQFKDAAVTIDVPIEPRHQPNVYVSVVLMSGRKSPRVTKDLDTGAPQLKVGSINLPVSAEDHQLKVTVKPNVEKMRPREKLAVDVQLRDQKDQAKSGEVTLWAVDEGVLSLTGAATPDPFVAFLGPQGLGVRNYSLMGALVRGRVGEEKGADGGGGGSGMVRGNFKDVAFYAGSLAVGADGRAHVEFDMPDNLTTYRLMAVASSGAAQFGHGDAKVQVSQPLMLLPSLPLQVLLGDQFEVALTVRNTSGAVQNVEVKLDAAKGLQAVGKNAYTLQLAAGTSKEAVFVAKASAAGKGEITLSASAGSYKDATLETVRVDDPRQVEFAATFGVALASVKEMVQKPANILEDTGGLTVTAATTGVLGLEDALTGLLDYPYGCTEQLSSKLLALLYLEQWNKDWQMGGDRGKTARLLAESALARLLTRQVGDGGLMLWPEDGEKADLAATAWALIVLGDAQHKGMKVDDNLLKRAGDFLRKQLSERERGRGTVEESKSRRALMLYALAQVGQADLGAMDALFEARASMTASGKLLLAQSMLAGDPARGKDRAVVIVQDLTRQLQVDGQTAHLQLADQSDDWEVWSSAVHDNALLLDVLVQAQPSNPLALRLARWLVQAQGNDGGHATFGSTQENAWALKALSRYFAVAEKTVPDVQLSVLLQNANLKNAVLHGRTREVVTVKVPQKQIPTALAVPVELRWTGTGPLYYTLRYDYAPTLQATVAKNAGLFVKRSSIDLRGQVNAQKIKRGEYVLVNITVLAPQPLRNIAIVDQLPAGLEPVDFQLKTGVEAMQRKLLALREGLSAEDGHPTADKGDKDWRDDSSFRELAGREVRFFVNVMSAGRHTYTYVARAATRGTFAGYGTKAQAMYRPEVFGTSGAVAIVVE